jgi:hypothetical protein
MNPLNAHAQAFYDEIVKLFELEPHERLLLEAASRVLERIEELEARLDGELVTQTARGGQPRVHPLVPEIRQQYLVLGRLLAALRLPIEGKKARDGFRGPYGGLPYGNP